MRLVESAIAAHQRGDLTTAETLYRQAIAVNASDFDALHMLGILCAQRQRFHEAEKYLRAAIAIDQSFPPCIHGYANVLAELGRRDDAISHYNRALQLFPNYAAAYSDRGRVELDLGRLADAQESQRKALAIAPGYVPAYYHLGNTLRALRRYAEALASYDRALALDPNFVVASVGRGNALIDLKRHVEALAAHDTALRFDPSLAEAWLGRGNALQQLKRAGEALGAYDKALGINPILAPAWLGRGNALFDLKRHDEALAAHDKALGIHPSLAQAWLGRGNVLSSLGRHDHALTAHDKALRIDANLAEAWLGRGNALLDLNRHDEARAAYDKALALDPDLPTLKGVRLFSKMQLCDWSDFETDCATVVSSIRNGDPAAPPHALLSIPSSPEDKLRCAQRFTTDAYAVQATEDRRVPGAAHGKIRIAYVSSDFGDHPVGHLVVGLIESHDRNRFDVIGVSTLAPDGSDVGQRIKRAFSTVIDASAMSDGAVVQAMRELDVDIAVDLNGHTRGARTGIFALRAAPVQVNFLGYAGTIGAPFIDYLVADHTVIPAPHRAFYAEKIAYLPHSYMPNDWAGAIGGSSPNRAEMGLPDTGIVFCGFNNAYKLNPDVFSRWIRILHAVDGSVLWLSDNGTAAFERLRAEARALGIDQERLVFARRVPLRSEHLARHRLADLFLDTLPYNAHTTAVDALWAGLPVLTQLGDSFEGRVAASLLTAVNLPELITADAQAYHAKAVALATSPEQLASLKARLAGHRATAPLFDTARLTRAIEGAFVRMHERARANLPPDHIDAVA